VPISLAVTPQLVASTGLRPLQAAIAEPLRYAVERKVDGVRGLVTFAPDGTLTTRNRRGEVRGWLRQQPLAVELRALGRRLPMLHDGTVLDGELVADRFAGTMAALMGSRTHGDGLQFVVFDVPILAGATSGRSRGRHVASGSSCWRRRSRRTSSCRRSSSRPRPSRARWLTASS
jgi:hypothetical protein